MYRQPNRKCKDFGGEARVEYTSGDWVVPVGSVRFSSNVIYSPTDTVAEGKTELEVAATKNAG